MHMRRIVLSSVACPAMQYFSTLSNNRPDFREKKVIEHKICDLIFSATFFSDISHWTKNWSRYDHKCVLVFMYSTYYSCPIWIYLKFLDKFSRNNGIKFHEHPFSGSWVVLCGRMDMTKIIVAFRSFGNASKIRCNERRTCLKNVYVSPIPTFPHFCLLLVKMP